MTDIADAEAAEVLWASSEQGKAAILAGCRKADDLGLPGTRGRPPAVIEPADISAIVYAAYLAAGWDAEPGKPAKLPPRGSDGMRDLTCGACGGGFGTNFSEEEIECAHCDARRCPHCGEWFGGDD
jgi:hypothetical protein